MSLCEKKHQTKQLLILHAFTTCHKDELLITASSLLSIHNTYHYNGARTHSSIFCDGWIIIIITTVTIVTIVIKEGRNKTKSKHTWDYYREIVLLKSVSCQITNSGVSSRQV